MSPPVPTTWLQWNVNITNIFEAPSLPSPSTEILILNFAYHSLASFYCLGFPDSSIGKESACNAGDPGLIPGLGRSPGEGIGHPLQYSWASFVTRLVKNPPAMQETWVWSLGWGDAQKKGKATHSSILAWRSPWGPWRSPWGLKESDTTERHSLTHTGQIMYIEWKKKSYASNNLFLLFLHSGNVRPI